MRKWKNLWIGSIAFLFSSIVLAQEEISPHALSYKFVVTDYLSLDPIYRTSTDRFLHPDDINYAAEIGYWYQLSPSFNLGIPLRIGSIDAYHNLVDPADPACDSIPCDKRYYRKEFFLSADLMGLYHFNNNYILKEDAFVQPYIGLGIGAVYMEKRVGHFDLQLPLCFGANIKIRPQFLIQAQLDYRPSLLLKKHNLALSLGFLWKLKQKG
jgi:hypothetical protein